MHAGSGEGRRAEQVRQLSQRAIDEAIDLVKDDESIRGNKRQIRNIIDVNVNKIYSPVN